MGHKIKQLEQENAHLKTHVDDLENYTRLDNLIIHGIPEPTEPNSQSASSYSDASTWKLILDMCHNRLGLDLTETDISTAHGIFSTNNNKQRPVLVRFASRRASLYGQKIASFEFFTFDDYANDHLTKHNANIYSQQIRLMEDVG